MSSDDDVQFNSTNFEPIAIVGMGMRLPGGIRRDKDFWNFLMEKRDGLCKVPGTRYNIDAFYDEFKQRSVKTQYGYFLQEDPAFFDTGFFSIGSYEAARLDPQQRLLMEVIWECMESAGQTQWKGEDIVS
jgi:acyl transferase domain-containing protein